MKRTDYVGRINEQQINKTVILKGWIARYRNLGKIIFVDLRDREGIVQLVFNQEQNPHAFEIANNCRVEYIIEIKGVVQKHQNSKGNEKENKIEINVKKANILAKSHQLPFPIRDESNVSEDLRLKYRYLDLRRPQMMRNLKFRSKVTSIIHNFFASHDFLDVETPNLTRSTPEGARDYVVPSRVYPGHFYALPQSPQLFKQLLMAAGVDRYYQMARCFRDEDLRGDRQPEFTQIDVEMSFVSAEEIQEMTEKLIKEIMNEALGINVKTPFPKIDWQEAMDKYGSDKPDTRFGMEIRDLTSILQNSDFNIFKNTIESNGYIRAICVSDKNKYSVKELMKKEAYIKRYGAKNLFWVRVTENGYTGYISKYISKQAAKINEILNADIGDLILIVAGNFHAVCNSLGFLRSSIANELEMIPNDKWNYLWVVNWPMFEYDEGFDKWIAAHHPFTMLNEEDLHYLERGEDPHKAHAQSYDIVLNGNEIGGGSIRIHDPEVQEKVFQALGYTKKDAMQRFGFLINALSMGMPPEGGIAFGFDRFVMLLSGCDNIRDVIPFPKNSKAVEPMTNAPGTISKQQLQDLHIKINAKDIH